MRIRTLLLVMILWSPFIFAVDLSIKTISEAGKSSYLLQISELSDLKHAEDLQKKLATVLNYPVQIEHKDEQSPYHIQIGPVNDFIMANQLRKIAELYLVRDKTTTALKPSSDKVWNLRNADIRAVIAEVSRVTGKNFIIDPRVQGKISIVSSTPMSDQELYQVFLSMLQVSGYAAIPSGAVVKIIPSIDAKTLTPDSLKPGYAKPEGDDMMVEVMAVHYVPAEQLVPVLRPLMPQWSNVSAYGPSNMLILSGRANNIKQLASIIKQVDSSSSNGIDMVPLQHSLAMDVAATLKDLVKSPNSSGLNNQTTIAADDRNNTLIISGNRTERLRLRMLIAQLDKQQRNLSGNNTQVIYLNYLRAEDLVPILGGIAQSNFSGKVGTTIGTVTRPGLDSTNPASSLVGTNSNNLTINQPGANPDATANTSSTGTQTEGTNKPSVQIIGEPNTNSVIINGPITLIRTLKSVISQLDIKPAQILIEALVAEINETDFNSLGIEWGHTDSNGGFKPGFAIINSKTSLDNFQSQIYSLAQKHKANILSTPSVVVLDNRQAKILIGKQVSVASSSYPNNANGQGTASPYTTFERVNVALHLYVRPQITRGNGIQMQIDQGNDTLDPLTGTQSGSNPIFNISAIVTSVHVESGNIIVLGGLSQDSLGRDQNQLPVLGNIPGIGRLFQHTIRNREKKVLMVFIRPLILTGEQEGIKLTGSKYNDIREKQLNSIREQEYNQQNDQIILPTLSKPMLPKPFSQQEKKPLAEKK
ncbi:MAG: GspD family T2SS secretin variant LspD [Legionella sp.]